MCGPSKTGTSSQSQSGSVSGSPLAQAIGTDAWRAAQSAASLPFQTYSGEFVAPVNQQQQTGITGVNQAAGTYAPYGSAALSSLSPYFGAATGTLGQGLSSGQGLTGAGVGLTAANASLNPNSIQQWMSPYIQNVVQATENQQQQQNQIQQSQLEGSAIQSGAFGGDRSGVAAANLAYQQNLANQPVIANLYNQGYSQALGQANTQQQTGLQAGAQLGALGNQFFNQGLSGSQQYQNLGTGLSGAYSGLGTTAQQNQLTAANAQLGAGTLQQQTQQAQDQALYNQFLQQQAYPFQTSQFLTNAAQAVAPLFGTQSTSTGSSAQPMSFFRRGGRVGPMVDLEMGDDGVYRVAKAGGGGLSDDALANLIAAHGQMYAPRVPSAEQGPYGMGLSSSGGHAQMPTVQLQNMISGRGSGSSTGIGHDIDALNKTADFGKNLAGVYSAGKDVAVGSPASTANGKATPASSGWFGYGGKWGAANPANPSNGGGISSAPLPAPAGVTLDANGIPVPALPDGTLISDDNYNSGGRVGLAAGGLPYTSGISDPYIPDDISQPDNLSQDIKSALNGSGGMAGMSGGQRSSGLGSAMSDINSAVSLGSSIAKAVPFLMALRAGGRIHKEGGGGLSDPIDFTANSDDGPTTILREAQHRPNSEQWARTVSQTTGLAPDKWVDRTDPVFNQGANEANDLFSKMLTSESGNQHFNSKTGQPTTSSKGAVGIAQVMPTTGPEAAKLAGVDWNPELFNRGRTGDPAKDKEAEEYNRKLGQAYYNEQHKTFGDPVIAAAAYNAGPQAVRDAQTRAQKEGGSYLDYLPKETQNYVSSLMSGRADPSAAVGAFVPSASSAASSAGSTPTPQPSWWDRESGGLSGTERGVISLLSGLGGMASSPSRFLGSAVLQGLGAGANTYGQLAQKGKALDISQQQANTAVGRLGIEGVRQSTDLYNKLLTMAQAAARNGQQPPEWLTSQIRNLSQTLYGYMPRPGQGISAGQGAPSSGGGLGASPPTLSTQTAPLPPPVQVTPLPAPTGAAPSATSAEARPTPPADSGMPQPRINDPNFLGQLPNEMNPQWLMQRSEELGALGDKDGADKMRADAQRLSEKYVNDGKAILPGGKVVNVPGWSEAAAAQVRVPENQKWIDDQATQAVQRAQARETLGVMQKVLENYEPGSLAGIKANAQALSKALGIQVPDSATVNAEAYDLFVKSTIQNVFQQVKDMGGKPLVTEIESVKKAVPNPELQPGANRQMLAQLYSRLDQADKFYQDVAPELDKNAGLNRGKWTADWLNKKENDINKMAAEKQKDIAVRGYVPPLSKMEEGNTYILEPGSEGAYGIAPGALGGAPMKAKYLGMKDGRPQFKRVE